MPNRSITVALRATVASYVRSMGTATASTNAFATATERAGAQASAGLASVDRAATTTAATMRTSSAASTASARSMGRAGTAARTASTGVASVGTAAGRTATNIERTGASATRAAGGLARAEGSARHATSSFHTLEHGASEAGLSLKTLGLGAAAAVAVGFGIAIKTAAEFEHQMSSVRANVTGSAAEFTKLTAAIKTQGTQFGFTAMDSAAAAEDLAKAGLDAQKIIGGGLVGALTLAAAGGISTGEAAETAATAMTMFALSSKDIPHIADLLAAGADRSTASVHSLAEGLMDGGSLAHLMGVSIENTTAVLAEFDQSGLKGAKAGNALKTMFQNMLAPSTAQQSVMEDLNLSFFDANGKFIGLAATAAELNNKLGGLDDKSRNAALSVLFGARSIQAANILYKDGAKGVKEWEVNTNDAGFAAKNAAAKTDNLVGDLNKTKAAAQNAAIDLGGRLTPALRKVAQFATGAVKGLTSLADGSSTGPLKDLAPYVNDAADSLKGLASLSGDALNRLSSLGNGAAHAGSKITGALGGLPPAGRSVVLGLGAAAAATRIFGSRIDALNAKTLGAAMNLRGMAAASRAFTNSQIIAANRASGMNRGLSESSAATSRLITTANSGTISMGRFGSSIENLGRRVPTIARMQGAFVNAAAGAERFPRAAGLAAAATTGLRGAAGGLVSTLGGPWGIAIGAGLVGLSLWQKHQQDAAEKVAEHKQRVDELTQAIQKDGGELGKAAAAQIAKNIVDSDTIGLAKKMGVSQELLTQGWLGQPKAVAKVNSALDAYDKKALQNRDSTGRLTEAAGKQREQVEKIRTAMQGQIKDTGDVTSKNKEYASSQKIATQAMNGSITAIGSYDIEQARLTQATKDSVAANKDLDDSLNKIQNTFLGMRDATRGYKSAIDDATAAAKKNGRTLDDNTSKGRANAEALDAVASKGVETIAALRKNGATAAELAPKLAGVKAQLYATAAQFGLTGHAADVYVKGALGRIPSEIKTTIAADTSKATANLRAARAAVQDLGVDFDTLPKSVQTKLIATGGKNAKDQLDGVATAAGKVPGQLKLNTSAPGADGSLIRINKLTVAAIDANGKIVTIPCSTPQQAAALHHILDLTGAAITADHKSINIPSSTPHALVDKLRLEGISGAAVDANGKSVNIPTAALRVPQTLAAIDSVLRAAHDKSLTITTVYKEIHPGDNLARHGRSLTPQAIGGPAGMPMLATGGVDYRGGGQVRGPGTTTSDSILARLSTGMVRLSNREHVLTANEVQQMGGHGAVLAWRRAARAGQFKITGHAGGGIAGTRPGWTSARPNSSLGGGLTDRDIARLAAAMGGRSVTHASPTYIDTLIAADYESFKQKSDATKRREALAGRRSS